MKRILITLTVATAVFATSGCCPAGKQAKETENAVVETIMARRSIRHYTDQAVPREVLQQLAECGVKAPNAMNRQAWEVRIIDDPDYFNGLTAVLKEAMPALAKQDDPKFRNVLCNATAAIAVACPDDESGMSLVNVGLLCENICLAAQSFGLGSVVMGGPPRMINALPEAKPYLDKLGFSEGYKLRIIVGLGYPDEAPDARPRDLGKIRFVE